MKLVVKKFDLILLRNVESTDCAPNNGYYFLPLSPDDRGAFILKGVPPRGWKIEPSEFELNIDGETDACSKGVDLNFEFIGFGITGSVLSKGADSSGKIHMYTFYPKVTL